jgi:GT2 family glycosyltransferase
MLRVSLVICTYNRPDDLNVALDSILRQTRLPDEMVIVDDGQLPAPPRKEEFEAKGVAYLYLRKEIPGGNESRNLAAKKSTGEIIAYLDDDVKLDENYLERLIEPLENDPGQEIIATCGWISNLPTIRGLRWLPYLYNLLWLNSGLREGKVLASAFCTGFNETPFPPKAPIDVDFLTGCPAVRREAFSQVSFSVGLDKIARGQDREFSIRLHKESGKRFVLVPSATFDHYETPVARDSAGRIAYRTILGLYRIYTIQRPKHFWTPLLFGYALVGYIAYRTLTDPLKRAGFRRIGPLFAAVRDIQLRRIQWPPPGEGIL